MRTYELMFVVDPRVSDEDVVTMTQDYAWLYKGEPKTPFAHKRETMMRFAERWLR